MEAPAQHLAGVIIAMLGVGARSVLAGQDPDDVGEFVAAGHSSSRRCGKRADSVVKLVRRRMGAWEPAPLGAVPDQPPGNPVTGRA